MHYELVAVGCSWGGLNALQIILGALPGDFGAPIVVAQHRMAGADDTMLPMLLDGVSERTVRDAEDKDELRAGEVLLAPPGYHLLVEDVGCVALSCEEPVRFSRPSIDVLFETAGDAYGDRLVGIVLTGSNADGSLGLAHVRRRGGVALVQDPTEAERPEMPEAALEAAPGAQVVRLADLPQRLEGMIGTVRT